MIEIASTDNVFVLTGAGISAESGIPTFRDFNGLWRGMRPEDVATPEAWQRDPQTVWNFYAERRKQGGTCRPNPAHSALAELERRLGDRVFVCTQNVDNLHEQAGSKHVVHMHGELFKSRCERCSREPFRDYAIYEKLDDIPRCQCGGRIRPHVCWFGEMPFELDLVFEKLERCTVFVTVGSSGLVEPAASFALWAGQQLRNLRPRKYYVGAESPANSVYFDQCFIGKAGEVLPRMFKVR